MTPISNDRIKLIDKVVKLLALAEGTNHDAEQESAKKMAARLMAQHNISLSEAIQKDTSFSKKTQTQTTKQPQKFDVLLAWHIAKFNGVALLTRSGGRKAEFIFIGKDSDIEATEYMFDVVKQQRKALHKKYEADFLEQYGRIETEQAWRLWHNGFTMGVGEKLKELTAMSDEAVTEKGLVPVSGADQALAWYEKDNKVRLNKGRMQSGSSAGWEAGKSVSVHKGVETNNDKKLIK